ncbi:MAG: hypothetical protein ACKOPS_10605 [Cyanobium sp.]
MENSFNANKSNSNFEQLFPSTDHAYNLFRQEAGITASVGGAMLIDPPYPISANTLKFQISINRNNSSQEEFFSSDDAAGGGGVGRDINKQSIA